MNYKLCDCLKARKSILSRIYSIEIVVIKITFVFVPSPNAL